MNLSSGVAATVSRTFWPFLNVTMPVKLTSEPMPSTRRIRSAFSPKQWNTPRDFAGEWLELRERVVESVALVDDAIQSGFDGDFELLLENVGLLLLVTRVVVGGEFRFLAGQTVIVQADFADGDDFGMLAHFAQGRAEVGRRFHGVGRMPADGGVNRREFFGEADGAFAAVQAGADGNDFGDAGSLERGR